MQTRPDSSSQWRRRCQKRWMWSETSCSAASLETCPIPGIEHQSSDKKMPTGIGHLTPTLTASGTIEPSSTLHQCGRGLHEAIRYLHLLHSLASTGGLRKGDPCWQHGFSIISAEGPSCFFNQVAKSSNSSMPFFQALPSLGPLAAPAHAAASGSLVVSSISWL